MKTNYFVFMFFIFASITLQAQNKIDKIDITYGEEIADDKGKIVKIIGEANNKIYTLILKGKEDYFLKIFDSKAMKQISFNQLVFPSVNDKELDFEEIVLLNDKIYAIGSVFHRKEKKFTLVGIEISEKGTLSNNMTTLFESTVANKSDRGGFYFKSSPDNKMLLVMHTALF